MSDLFNIAIGNYHYKRFSFNYFLESVERLGCQNIELWASGPHFHLEDFSYNMLTHLKREIIKHNLNLICMTPESCVYPISLSHPSEIYRKRSIDFYCKHIIAATILNCPKMVITQGITYLDIDKGLQLEWLIEALFEINKVARLEGVLLVFEPLSQFSNSIINRAFQVRELINQIDSPYFCGMLDTDIMARVGMDTVEDYIFELGNKLMHVHFVDGNPGGHLVPGEGNIDLEQIYKALKKYNYHGFFSLELLDSRYFLDPELAIRNAIEWFEKLW